MTTPGGVPNLPAGALTLDTLATKLQDMSGAAMKARAVQRFPSIMNTSTGLDPSLDITPFGILTSIWATVNSLVANADPADIQGPEDLPELVLEFIEGLPVVGQFVGLLEAILGTYDGDDATLLSVQALFAPIRAVMQLLTGQYFPDLLDDVSSWDATAFINDLIKPLGLLLGFDSPLPAFNLFGTPPTSLFDLLPGNSISFGTHQNYLANPVFSDADSIAGGPDWVWDGTVKHGDALGSAKAVADGNDKDLYSSAMAVVERQQARMMIRAQWSGLTYTGTQPIQLLAKGFQTDPVTGVATEVDSQMIDTIKPSGAAGSWEDLDATYDVPTGLGINEVRMCLHLDHTATAGSVWFSDGLMDKNYVPNIIPSDWVAGLEDAFNSVDDSVVAVVGGFLHVLTGLPWVGWAFADLEDEFNDFWNDAQTTAGQASDAHGGVQDMIDALTKSTNQQDAPGTGYAFPGLDDLFGVNKGQAAEITQIAAGQAQLRADIKAQNVSGKSFPVTVADYTGVPSVFTKVSDSGSGAVINDGDTLEWDSNTTGRELYLYNADVLLTDYFEVSLVIPRQSELYFGGGANYHYFLGRANAAGTTACFMVMSGNQVRMGCFNSGSTTIASPTWFGSAQAVVPGSYVTFRGGVVGVDRRFQILVNNVVRQTYNDAGAVSAMGPLYRSVGWGLEAQAVDLIQRTGNISDFYANDNFPAPIASTVLQTYRSIPYPTVVTMATGDQELATGALDTTEFASNIGWDGTTATILTDGTYAISFCLYDHDAAGIGTSSNNRAALFINGAVKRWGGSVSNASGASSLALSVELYLTAGTTVRPGGHIENAISIVGSASGVLTWFTMVKIS